MFDMSSITKNLSKPEKDFIEWLNDNGFDGKVIKHYQSKTEFRVSKDGIENTVNIPNSVDKGFNIKAFCNNYLNRFETLKELQELRNARNSGIESDGMSMEI